MVKRTHPSRNLKTSQSTSSRVTTTALQSSKAHEVDVEYTVRRSRPPSGRWEGRRDLVSRTDSLIAMRVVPLYELDLTLCCIHVVIQIRIEEVLVREGAEKPMDLRRLRGVNDSVVVNGSTRTGGGRLGACRDICQLSNDEPELTRRTRESAGVLGGRETLGSVASLDVDTVAGSESLSEGREETRGDELKDKLELGSLEDVGQEGGGLSLMEGDRQRLGRGSE